MCVHAYYVCVCSNVKGGGGRVWGPGRENVSHWLKYFLWQLENVILAAEALQCVLQRGRANEREREGDCV